MQIEKGGSYIASLASQMISYPLEHIIDHGYVVDNMDEKAILAKLDAMNIENARILFVDEKVKTDKKTKYFEAPYSVSKITTEQKQRWLDFSKNPELKLPELNPYFATDFSLNAVDKSRTMPKLIEQQQGTQIYAMPSHYFGDEPKVALLAGLKIMPEVIDLKQGVSAVLLTYMADLARTKLAFQSSVAGLSFSPRVSENGLGFYLEGYTQHILRFLQDSVKNFSEFELTESFLNQAKERYIEALDRLDKESAARQAGNAISQFASYPYFEIDKAREMVKQITISDVKFIREKLLTQATSLRLLSVGNLSDEQVKALATEITKLVKNNNTALDYGRYLDINQSQRKLNYVKQIPHEDNAFTISYFAHNIPELEGRAQSILLRDVISRWYFDDLRTDKQLGYAVYARRDSIGKTSGIQFLVQSPTASPKTIMEHNQRFIQESLEKLKKMSADEFEKYRASLLERLQHKPESLAEEFEEFSGDFALGNDKFDRKAQLIAKIKETRQQDVIDFYQSTIVKQKGLVFASQAIGTNKAINQAAELNGFEKVESIEKLQREFELKPY